MDTRFWGPSGWKLLHSITFTYIPRTDKLAVREMFESLPFVLPCKFCRISLTEYMEKHPLEPALASRESLTKWLWIIHNEVNAKLRSQSIAVEADPPFEKVSAIYKSIVTSGCTRTDFPGWDFLFSIADLHPMSKIARASIPVPGPTGTTLAEKNKTNSLKPHERMPMYMQFWRSIGKTLPFKEWRDSWARSASVPIIDSRSTTMKWLWNIRCSMEHDLELLNKCEYSSLCKNLQSHRSGCNKSKRARTCRKRKN